MKMIKQTLTKSLLVVMFIGIASLVVIQPPVFAANAIGGGGGGGGGTTKNSGVKCSVLPQTICDEANTKTGGQAIWDFLIMVLNILTAGVGVAAVIGIIVAALQYSSAEEKADQVHNAKMRIWNIILGLIFYLIMYAFLQFLIPGGIFS